jgi:gamma-glutamyl-gamma-aminobutyrate hydrolase PuuD
VKNPLVGITAWRRELDTFLGGEMLHTLSDYCTSAVINAGMTPVMFPNGQDPADAARLVSLVDGRMGMDTGSRKACNIQSPMFYPHWYPLKLRAALLPNCRGSA